MCPSIEVCPSIETHVNMCRGTHLWVVSPIAIHARRPYPCGKQEVSRSSAQTAKGSAQEGRAVSTRTWDGTLSSARPTVMMRRSVIRISTFGRACLIGPPAFGQKGLCQDIYDTSVIWSCMRETCSSGVIVIGIRLTHVMRTDVGSADAHADKY